MKQKLHIVLSIALVASLAVNGYLLYSQNQLQTSFNETLTALEVKTTELSATGHINRRKRNAHSPARNSQQNH